MIDVPPSMGGRDRGPTPPKLLVASLGSCVAAFVASYCERTGLDTHDMTVDVTDATFDKAEEPTRLTDLRVIVNLPHVTCGERERAIRRVAAHCPVHETVATMSDIAFEIRDQTGLAACALTPDWPRTKAGRTRPRPRIRVRACQCRTATPNRMTSPAIKVAVSTSLRLVSECPVISGSRSTAPR